MTDTLRQLIDACYASPLERTPQDMVKDYCQEHGVQIILDAVPPVVPVSYSEALQLGQSVLVRHYLMRSYPALEEALSDDNPHRHLGFPEYVARVRIVVDDSAEPESDRCVVLLYRPQFPDSVAYFYRWVLRVWQHCWGVRVYYSPKGGRGDFPLHPARDCD